MGLFSSRKSSVKKEAKFAEPPAAAPAPAAVAAASSDDLSLQKTEGFRRGSALATKQDLEAATLADFDVVRVLGRGAFGKVSLVQHKTSHEKYALKTLNKKMLVAVKQSKGAITEREVLKQKGHPCIVRLYWAFQDDESLHMVLDYLPGGDLDLLLERSGPLGPQAARFYVGCAALGLEALHAQDVAHRDLKPENLCIASDGYARIADLGYARSLPTEARAQKPSGAGLCRPARALTACCAVPRTAGPGANPARHSRVSRPGDFPRRGPRQRGRARWWKI